MLRMSWTKVLPDSVFISLDYYQALGKCLQLKNPQTFNEKMQWLKLHDRNTLYTTMVDKALVKDYVAQIIGEQYVIPTYGVWEKPEDIDFNSLPNQFVLKTTHDSGGVVVCKNKDTLDREMVIQKLRKRLARNYYYRHREWPYRNVIPRIIAEQYMQDEGNDTLPVYKVFNFGGQPSIIQAIQNDKTPEESIDYFDIDWRKLAFKQNFPNSKTEMKKPEKLTEILELARKLNMDLPFLRTDFYVVNGQVYFSEFTFYSDAGLARFDPDMWDYTLGNWLTLPCIPQETIPR